MARSPSRPWSRVEAGDTLRCDSTWSGRTWYLCVTDGRVRQRWRAVQSADVRCALLCTAPACMCGRKTCLLMVECCVVCCCLLCAVLLCVDL